MNFARKSVALLLVLQWVLSPLAPRPVAQASDIGLSPTQVSILTTLSNFENSDEKDLPKTTTDAFLLVGQKLQIPTEGSQAKDFDLSLVNLSIPEITVTDLEKEVQVQINPSGMLEFVLMQKNQIKAVHQVSKLRPIAFARDKEILAILDQSGAYYAIDMGYAKDVLFRSPLPVIHLADTKVKLSAIQSPISLQFLSRSKKPFAREAHSASGLMPLDLSHSGRVLLAGSLVTQTETSGEPQLIEMLDRSVMRTQIYTAESVLAFLAYRLSPEGKNLSIPEGVSSLPEISLLSAEASTQMNPSVKAAILAISPSAFDALQNRAKTQFSQVSERVDQFQFNEWVSHARALSEKARAEASQSPAPITPQELIYRFLTPQRMKLIAGVVLGGSAMFTVAQLIGNHSVWAIHFMNQMHDQMIPSVLKDQAYRMTLLKSSIGLAAFIPLLWSMGFIGNKVARSSWSAVKRIASMGMKTYAAIQLPFYHRLAALTRQESFLASVRVGLNPLKKVKADSRLGRAHGLQSDIHPGIQNPFWNSKNGDQQQIKAEVSASLLQEKERLNTLAWLLASTVVSEDLSVDPVTLSVLGVKASQGGIAMNAAQIESFLNEPEFQKKWSRTAFEIRSELEKLSDPAVMSEIESISADDLARFYALAKQTSERIKTRSGLRQKIQSLKFGWNKFAAQTIKGAANFGLEQHEFLKSAEPSDFVVSQFWKQFLTDYALAIVQIGTVGPRANLADPSALAANENGVLYTNLGHLSEMADQVRIYAIGVPSSMAMVYQKASQITEDAYAPVEDHSLLGVQRTENFGTGVKNWLKGAGNLVEADYGAIWMKGLLRQIKTAQAGALMSIGSRMAFGGQEFTNAGLSYIYSVIWGTWQYGWMWEPTTRGNQIYQDSLKEDAEIFMKIKTALGQSIRLQDPAEMANQMKSLRELYRQSKTQFPKELDLSIDWLFEQLSAADPASLFSFKAEIEMSSNEIDQLRKAIIDGSASDLGEAKGRLLANYQASGLDSKSLSALTQLNAVSILHFALENPPYAVKPHGGVEWMTTLLAAVGTTYYATAMAVDTFRTDIAWGEKLGHAAVISSALYAGTYYFPKLWKKAVGPSVQKIKSFCGELMLGNSAESQNRPQD